jgi:hypothetical protein
METMRGHWRAGHEKQETIRRVKRKRQDRRRKKGNGVRDKR